MGGVRCRGAALAAALAEAAADCSARPGRAVAAEDDGQGSQGALLTCFKYVHLLRYIIKCVTIVGGALTVLFKTVLRVLELFI